jgi:hypothetical protein
MPAPRTQTPRYNRPMQLPRLRSWRVLRDWAIAIAFWLPASLLAGWQMYGLYRRAHVPLHYQDLLLVYAARYLSVAILTPPIFYAVIRWPVTGRPLGRVIAYTIGYLPFAVAFAVIRWLLLPPWMEETMSWGARTPGMLLELIYATFADVLLLYLGVVIAAHAYAYFVRGQRQEIEHLKLKQSLAQSELQTLRAQLHPHFLFNTLQGISALIETDRETAQSMLLTLAGLLRTVLKCGSTDLITCQDELAFVKAYLQLEQMRLGRRLTVRWQIEPGVEGALLPQLLLQPLVENAVVHGIAGSRDGGWIEIGARLEPPSLVIIIRNSIGGASRSGLGLGITNTMARLRWLYGQDATFDFEIHGARIAVARLAVPAFTTSLAEVVNA